MVENKTLTDKERESLNNDLIDIDSATARNKEIHAALKNAVACILENE